MPFSIPLKFIPPSEPNIVKLHIWEGVSATSLFHKIETTEEIGVYPSYIDEFVTIKAADPLDWFAIQWEDYRGAFTQLSAPIQGGTKTLVGEVVERVMIRSSSLNEIVVAQEAEEVIEWVFSQDPYTVDLNSLTYTKLNALADLVLVAVLYTNVVERSGTAQDYTAGMISERTSINVKSVTDGLLSLENRALTRLGIGTLTSGSRIASFVDDRRSKGEFAISAERTTFDSSRSLQVRAIMTEVIAVRDINLSGFPITQN